MGKRPRQRGQELAVEIIKAMGLNVAEVTAISLSYDASEHALKANVTFLPSQTTADAIARVVKKYKLHAEVIEEYDTATLSV